MTQAAVALLTLVALGMPREAAQARVAPELACVASSTVFCVDGNRFRVSARFRNGNAAERPATGAVIPAGEGGNPETVVLSFGDLGAIDLRVVLEDRCSAGGSIDLVAAASTFASFRIEVEDLVGGVARNIDRGQGAGRGTFEVPGAFACASRKPTP